MSEVELTIERLGRRGDGIGQYGGHAVYAARMLPGERITGVVSGDRIDNPKIIVSAPERVAPPCRHYKSCGGCAVQHASDGFVAAWKADQVRRALAAQGLDAPIRSVRTSPPRSRRRAVLTGRRTKSGAIVGFHGRGSDSLVDITDCHVLDVQIMESLPVLRDLVAGTASRKGALTLAVTQSPEGLDIAVSGGKDLEQSLISSLTTITKDAGIARLTWGDELVFQDTPPRQTFGTAQVTPPPGAFLQATSDGEAALVAGVSEALAGAKHIADLFAGCGTFSLPLAKIASVHSVEGEAVMLAALTAGWRTAAGLKPVTTKVRDLFRRPLLADELAKFDGIVIDPPRAGAEAQSRLLADHGPPRLAMVSCDPATFARDAAILTAGGYRIGWIDVVDQFRWSAHVELVAALWRD